MSAARPTSNRSYRRRGRCEIALVGALALLPLLPFLGAAVSIDAPVFLAITHQIVAHPADPFGFDMIWDPVFSPCGRHVAAKAEKNGKYTFVVNGRSLKKNYEAVWEPVFGPDGDRILLKYIEEGKYYRHVALLKEIVDV